MLEVFQVKMMIYFKKKITISQIVVQVNNVEIKSKEEMECVAINAIKLDAHNVFTYYAKKINNFVLYVKCINLIIKLINQLHNKHSELDKY